MKIAQLQAVGDHLIRVGLEKLQQGETIKYKEVLGMVAQIHSLIEEVYNGISSQTVCQIEAILKLDLRSDITVSLPKILTEKFTDLSMIQEVYKANSLGDLGGIIGDELYFWTKKEVESNFNSGLALGWNPSQITVRYLEQLRRLIGLTDQLKITNDKSVWLRSFMEWRQILLKISPEVTDINCLPWNKGFIADLESKFKEVSLDISFSSDWGAILKAKVSKLLPINYLDEVQKLDPDNNWEWRNNELIPVLSGEQQVSLSDYQKYQILINKIIDILIIFENYSSLIHDQPVSELKNYLWEFSKILVEHKILPKDTVIWGIQVDKLIKLQSAEEIVFPNHIRDHLKYMLVIKEIFKERQKIIEKKINNFIEKDLLKAQSRLDQYLGLEILPAFETKTDSQESDYRQWLEEVFAFKDRELQRQRCFLVGLKRVDGFGEKLRDRINGLPDLENLNDDELASFIIFSSVDQHSAYERLQRLRGLRPIVDQQYGYLKDVSEWDISQDRIDDLMEILQNNDNYQIAKLILQFWFFHFNRITIQNFPFKNQFYSARFERSKQLIKEKLNIEIGNFSKIPQLLASPIFKEPVKG